MRQPTSRSASHATATLRRQSPPDWLIATLSALLTREQMDELKRAGDDHPWTVAVERGWTTDERILHVLAERFRMRIAGAAPPAPRALQEVTETLARRYRVLPLALTDSTVDIATSDPYDLDCERSLAFVLGRNVRMFLAAPAEIARRLDEAYRPGRVIEKIIDEDFTGLSELVPVNEEPPEAELNVGESVDRPIVRLVDRIVAKAIQCRSSDIHLEPAENGVIVRYRIDGVLKNDSVIPRGLSLPLVARVKIMARLNIADRLRPQDGRARVAIDGRPVDLRVSTLPASLGEKVVIRILDVRQTVLSLDALGFDQYETARVLALLEAREGLLCVTGPTGSGKTTTLYSIVRHIQRRGVNIVTVEDPVEYRLEGIVQVQVNEKTGLTFPAALRSILRQDPDVILVGEIRDRDTAQIAVQAALTGHLVLTTLHTIDAASAVMRLTDIGIEGYKVAAALKGIVAQRLLRRLCAGCKARADDIAPLAIRDVFRDTVLFASTGCDECARTGFRGRLAIAEILASSGDVERCIVEGAAADRINDAARLAGMRSMWESAVENVRQGTTSVAELLRVLEAPVPPPRPEGVRRTDGRGGGGLRAPAVLRERPVPAPLRVFEGGAFDLLDEYAADTPVRRSVLVADTVPESRRDLCAAFAEMGFAVHEAPDGATALDTVDRAAPDVVVLDLEMPDVDAFGLIARVRGRSRARPTPVIATSAPDDDAEVRALEHGADDYLPKPLRPRALVARVNKLLKR